MKPPRIRHSLHPIPMYRWSDQDDLVAPAVDPITAPHDCMMPNCPGPVNKRKLEAFDDLLAALKACEALLTHYYDNSFSPSHALLEELALASAAIAKASPQAPGPG